MKQLIYVTGNQYKIELAKKILTPFGFEIIQSKIDCPEIQDNDIENVSKFSAKYSAEKLKTPVIKNDSGLFIEALNGFPGPYTSYVEDTITEDGILKLMAGKQNRRAYFLEVISYCEPGCEPVSFVSKTNGSISTDKQGKYGWSFDRIFIPSGQDKTLAQFEDEKRWKFWSNDAYLSLKNYLTQKHGEK